MKRAWARASPGVKKVRRVAALDGWLCRFCARMLAIDGDVRIRATIDHWVPRSRGGANDIYNWVLACAPCNLAKGSLTGAEFLAIPYHEREELRLRHLRQISGH